MQFKKVFEAINLKMPVLVYRKSFFLIQKSMYSKWLEMGWEIDDIKKDEKELTERYLDKQKLIPISFETQLNQLVLVLEEIKNEIALIDKSLLSSINAEEQKFKNALLVIQSKLNKANRNKFEKQLSVIKKTKEKLFPMGIPQERVENIFQYFVKYPGIIDFVMQNIDLNSSNSSLLCLDDGNSNY
jgi:uncharacterized protein YllA (UPF0747 family)